MKKTSTVQHLIISLLLILCIGMLAPTQIQAADTPLSISSCKLNSSGKKLTVKASVKEKTSSTKKKLYLIGMDSNSSDSGTKSTTPLASGKVKGKKITFSFKYKSTMLYQKFAIAYKTKGKYKIISNAIYITNPEVLATYTGSGSKTISKKGLQVEDFNDAQKLRPQHAVLNWTINSILTTSEGNTVPFKYRGTTYYFNANVLQYNDSLVQAYNAAGAKVTIILLLQNDNFSATSALRYSGSKKAHYTSFHVSTKKGCRTFEALMTFLGQRYGTKQNLVSGWILGNEVNTPGEWNYAGGKSLGSYMKDYAKAFRICYNAVKSVSKKSKVYISLDYNWNLDSDGNGRHYFSSKSTLNEFYKRVNTNGKVVFNIAYHAYPQGLIDPVFWDDTLATDSSNSTFINFKNLSVLTNYVKKNFGKAYTITLSEQSFNSTKGEAIQAAAYAYAYYISEGNSMIESFIYGREIDHPTELASNCYWGLLDTNGNKRLIWDVFQYIDSKDSLRFTAPLLKYTNLSKWEKISGHKKSKYDKMTALRQKISLGNLSVTSTSSVTMYWKSTKYGDGYEIYRNNEKIETIMDTNCGAYVDENLIAGQTYTYKVRMFKIAPDKKNAEKKVALYGSFSASKEITVSASKLEWNSDACSVNGKKISLGWISQKGVSGYAIYRSTSADGNYALLTSTTQTKYTDSDTKTGTHYYYKICGFVTKDGQNYYGAYSDVISLQALIQLKAGIADEQLHISFSEWEGAIKYQIFCAAEDDEKFTRIKTITDLTNLSYTCVTYKNSDGETVPFDVGNTYLFKVRAYLADGSYTDYSNVASVEITEELVALKADTLKGSTEETEATEMIETETTETENTETENTETEVTETEATENTETEATETETTATENTETEATESEAAETETTETTATESEATETTEATETEETETTATENTEKPNTETGTATTEIPPAEADTEKTLSSKVPLP